MHSLLRLGAATLAALAVFRTLTDPRRNQQHARRVVDALEPVAPEMNPPEPPAHHDAHVFAPRHFQQMRQPLVVNRKCQSCMENQVGGIWEIQAQYAPTGNAGTRRRTGFANRVPSPAPRQSAAARARCFASASRLRIAVPNDTTANHRKGSSLPPRPALRPAWFRGSPRNAPPTADPRRARLETPRRTPLLGGPSGLCAETTRGSSEAPRGRDGRPVWSFG